NDPLNQRMVNGRPLYAGVAYAAGVRQERITEGIRGLSGVTREAMEALQHDSRSTVGVKMTPALLAALEHVAAPGAPGAPPDVGPFVAALPAPDRDRLLAARALLAAWTFATPAEADAGGASAATAILNTWMHFFIEGALADELGAVGFDVWGLNSN